MKIESRNLSKKIDSRKTFVLSNLARSNTFTYYLKNDDGKGIQVCRTKNSPKHWTEDSKEGIELNFLNARIAKEEKKHTCSKTKSKRNSNLKKFYIKSLPCNA